MTRREEEKPEEKGRPKGAAGALPRPSLPTFFQMRMSLRRAPGRLGRTFLRLYLFMVVLSGAGSLLEKALPHAPQLRLAVIGLLATSVVWLMAWWWARQILRSNSDLLPLLPLSRKQLVMYNMKRLFPALLLVGCGGVGLLGGALLAGVTGIRATPFFLLGHLLVCGCLVSVALAEEAGIRWTRAFFAPRSIPGLVFLKAPGAGRWFLLAVLLVGEGFGIYHGFRWLAGVEPGRAGAAAEFLYLLFNPHGALLRMHHGGDPDVVPWPLLSVFALVGAGGLFSFRRVMSFDPAEAERAGYEQWLELRPDTEIVMGTQPERLPLMEEREEPDPGSLPGTEVPSHGVGLSHPAAVVERADSREAVSAGDAASGAEGDSLLVRRRLEVPPAVLQEALRRVTYYEHQADRFVASYTESARKPEAAVVSCLMANGGRGRSWGIRLLLPVLTLVFAGILVLRTGGHVPPWIPPVGGTIYSVAVAVALLRPASAASRVFSALGGLPARWPQVAWIHHLRAWRFLLGADLLCTAIVLSAYGVSSLTMAITALALLNGMRIAGYTSVWHRWLDFTGRKLLFFLWIIPAGVLGVVVAAGAFPISVMVDPGPEAAARDLKTVLQMQLSLVAVYLVWSLSLGFFQWLRDRWQIMAVRPPQSPR